MRNAQRVTRRRAGWAAAAVTSLTVVALAMRPDPVAVDVVAVRSGPLETTIDAEGVTRLRQRYAVAAPISGRLERIAVQPGDEVRPGDVLARITPLPLDVQAAAQAEARVAAAQAILHEAQARSAQMQAALPQAERTVERLHAMAEIGAVSAEAVERAELQLVLARRDSEASAARSHAAAAELAAARAALIGLDGAARSATVVRAPAGGRVLAVPEPSERVVAAGTPLLLLGDAAALEVAVDVLSTEAVRVRPGATVRLVDWGGAEALEARVRTIEPAGFTKVSALGVEEQRVWVIADLLHAPAELGDGYQVQARIVTWQASKVIKVPNSALFRDGDSGWRVFVVHAGRAALRDVRVGRRGMMEAEVITGLEAGERVIAFPSDRIGDGARVRVAQR